MTAPLIVRALRREAVERTPVWYMRQAGRCLAEYRVLRERYGILEMARTPELCARVTRMPVERLGVDAAVLYADIMLPLDGMGVPFHIKPDIGPIVERPVRTAADVDALRIIPAEEATPYLFETIRARRSRAGSTWCRSSTRGPACSRPRITRRRSCRGRRASSPRSTVPYRASTSPRATPPCSRSSVASN